MDEYEIEEHLCYTCAKAESGTCSIYEDLVKIVEDHFNYVKIMFHIPECEYYISDEKQE